MITISNGNTNVVYASSGLFEAQNDEWIHPRRIIDSYELIYVVKGRIHLEEDGHQHIINENEVIILLPGRMHRGYKTSAAGTSFYWFHFYISDYSMLEKLPKSFALSDNLKMKTLLSQLLDTTNSPLYPDFTPDLIAGTILCELLAQYNHLNKQGRRLTNEIAEWIRINSDKKISVMMVSEKFRYNPDYLTRLFKTDFNMGIKEYIYAERIKAAKNLLISSFYSIKQISDILGWHSLNQFIKFFKYHETVSPKKYRDLYVNTHLNKK